MIKDPTSSGEDAVSDAVGEWRRFRSTLFVCHLRGHRRPRKQEDAQPFVRSYGGRQWTFAHDGDLVSEWKERFVLPDDPAFEPLGGTDSEHAFCWLLARMHTQRARSIADLQPDTLMSWLHELNADGRLNVVLTDGEHLAAYRDSAGKGSLCWTRRIPPHANTRLASDGVLIALDAPEDPNRTALVFSSLPLDEEPWRASTPGSLYLARRGSILWTSDPQGSTSQRPERDLGEPRQLRSEARDQAAAAQPLPRTVAHRTRRAERVLRIVHETSYEYGQPVERSSHRLLLRPVEDRSQSLDSYALSIDPDVMPLEYEDVFGNAAFAIEIAQPYQRLGVICESSVRIAAPPTLEQRMAHARHSIPLVWMPWQRQMLSAYLLPPELPETQLQELSEFAMSFVERNDYDLVGSLLDINETLYRDFEYASGSTTVETTPFQIFEARRGVCQDFANLMICLARLLHIPARYRMGYIFTGADYENKIQSEASHAWLELYLPRVGWHGFDPTNGIQVGSEHVRVACGRNYRDATPTSGTIYRGGGMETLTVSVRVEEAEQASL